MTQVAVFIHSIAKHDDYQRLLQALYDRVIEHAQELHDGTVESSMPAKYREQLLRNAQGMAEDEIWCPLFGMMDANDAIRIGFQLVFVGIAIRLCQYHVVRNVRSRFKSYYGGKNVSEDTIELALEAFRRSQRCPREEEFEEHFERLLDEVQSISDEEGRKGVDDRANFESYLLRSCYHERWRKSACDYGLPSGQMRDLYMSTNNATERAFCVFDRTFLCARANKR